MGICQLIIFVKCIFLVGPYHVFSDGGLKHFHSMVDDFVNVDIFDAPIKETISNLSQITMLKVRFEKIFLDMLLEKNYANLETNIKNSQTISTTLEKKISNYFFTKCVLTQFTF